MRTSLFVGVTSRNPHEGSAGVCYSSTDETNIKTKEIKMKRTKDEEIERVKAWDAEDRRRDDLINFRARLWDTITVGLGPYDGTNKLEEFIELWNVPVDDYREQWGENGKLELIEGV